MAAHPLVLELRHERERRHLSQQVVADRLGVSRMTVLSWENGYRRPGIAELQRWAAVLGYDLALVLKTQHITERSTAA
jgi:transcriptional regulator with XRE-family HTH domain